MKRLSGKILSQKINDETKVLVQKLAKPPCLAVLLVGTDPASHLYVSLKEKMAHELGIKTVIRRVPAQTPDTLLLELIDEWNRNSDIHGILIQVPLPPGHDTDALIQAMSPEKDVDTFHPTNIKRLLAGEAQILSPVHEGIMRLIASTGIAINHARTAVIMNSETFAKPLGYVLSRAGAVVEYMSPDTFDAEHCRTCDIIVIAVGQKKFLKKNAVKNGAVIIDVGTNRESDGRVVGDVDFLDVSELDGWLTPVPGGVGPMTIAILLKNVVTLATPSFPRQEPLQSSFGG
ncbi:bifunctional 5,10-methylenetetrahydrofolate dehydrogenase/5,10-methenyltetrahydrofolate cyclohydrolase [Candidatus Uhrbacteria bacterium]|nr:bifunctional 5,10-methylenetetrahydrofolate dehydrogenase/5,10-methenyltetrahydrofolate cyclohydrolase [Candidatus Uhrbacteria bacterium]